MRRFLIPLAVLFAFSLVTRADDAADAKAMIEKAIKARGDKADSKNNAMTWKEKGRFSGNGVNVEYKSDWAFQGPDKYRFVLVAEIDDAKVNMTYVVNGEKAWILEGGQSEEMAGEKLAQSQNDAYQFWVTSLAPLVNDKGFTLATAKGKDVDGKATTAVKVTCEKKPELTLFFDKESGLLVKREVMVKDEFQGWKEVLDEATFSDYKETNGVKYFTKLKIVRDGKTLIDSTISDAKASEKLDTKLFERP